MPQHNLQHAYRKDSSFAPSERPESRPLAAPVKAMIAALALTATLFLGALGYVGGYAGVTRNEYQRQAMVQELRRLEAENARLRCQIDAAGSQAHIMAAATQQDLVQADPARDVDYLVLAPGSQPTLAQAPAPTAPIAYKRRLVAAGLRLLSPPTVAAAPAGAMPLHGQ